MDFEIKEIISDVFKCSAANIKHSKDLKSGMTNDSIVFSVKGNPGHYILRVPGAGTDMLISRENEYEVYQKILPLGICDDIVYICKESGVKISRYWENSRICDKNSADDVKASMKVLRDFHDLGLSVPHEFCLFERIQYYEGLLRGKPSRHCDYGLVKSRIFGLKNYLSNIKKSHVLTHIDAVPSNFLFLPGGEIHLIDWEYAAMQDPHIDIAMFAVYSMYDKKETDSLIDMYFCEGVLLETRKKIYAYVAICGLLWSNWCEYKAVYGVEFGEYALSQYRFAKEYYDFFTEFRAS